MPKILFIESDNKILGTPFFVSEFVDGRAPGDSKPYTLTGWVPESSPEQLQTMVFSGMEAMARLHALDWQGCGLGFLRRGGPAESELALDLQYYIDCCDWAYGGRWDLVSDVADWLKKHWPQSERLAFSWGDARLGNMLWRDHRPVAILDWDWAAIADPERDLGYWLLNHLVSGALLTRAFVPGMKERRWGRVIYVSSAAAYRGFPSGHAIYSAMAVDGGYAVRA